MLRLEVPNVFFDIFNNNSYDGRCGGSNWWGADHYHHLPLDAHYFADPKPMKRLSQKVSPLVREKPAQVVRRGVPFSVQFDVSTFAPSEVFVKLLDRFIIVECKHEQKADDGHFEYRRFLKKVPIPDGCITEHMKCKLDQTGMLQIEAPVVQTVEAVGTLLKKDDQPEEEMMEVQKDPEPEPEVTEPPKPKESEPEVIIEDIGPEFD